MNRLGFLFLCLAGLLRFADAYQLKPDFAPPAGQSGSTAIHLSDAAIVDWADGYEGLEPGEALAPIWANPVKALGPAEGLSGEVVSLGRGGRITLTFSQGISDGPGYDFAVFENSFSDYFLELGWVEVSSDGTNFTRFPNFSYSPNPVPAYGQVDSTLVYGFAGKYRQGYGTPFDLSELQLVADSIAQGAGTNLSHAYVSAFTNNYPLLDVGRVQYVRIVDVIGDGRALDIEGYEIYDPYATSGSAGFDLDAVGVLSQPVPAGPVQRITFDDIPHQKLSFGAVELDAVADSGLPVQYVIRSGPAELAGSVLSFTGTGVVEVVASQPGNAEYISAAPVLRSFRVADEIQHIFIVPVPNQLKSSGTFLVNALSSAGLPVRLEVAGGPASVMIGETDHVLNLGNEIGTVTLRAYQAGDAQTAPAEDVYIDFEIVESGATNAPQTLAAWAAEHSVPADGRSDSDSDGVLDFQEFMLGGDPHDPAEQPKPRIERSVDQYGRDAVRLAYAVDRRAMGQVWVSGSVDLSVWSNKVPEMVEITGNPETISLKVQIAVEDVHGYYRLVFE